MQLSLKLVRDGISPSLAKKVRAGGNPQLALRAAGEVLVQMAKRSFDEPSLRPAPWAPLKTSTVLAKAKAGKSSSILKASGTMWRSFRVIGVDATRVTVGSDRPYAGFHQLGTQHIPARPFFPITPQGKLTAAAKARVEAAMQKRLDLAE
jgi:phage gpG-like protein